MTPRSSFHEPITRASHRIFVLSIRDAEKSRHPLRLLTRGPDTRRCALSSPLPNNTVSESQVHQSVFSVWRRWMETAKRLPAVTTRDKTNNCSRSAIFSVGTG